MQQRLQSSARAAGCRPPFGFTLVELLVVVAIIAALAAVLVPSLRNAREQARKSVCLSNMRQAFLGFLGYADDHGGWGPGHASHHTCSDLMYPASWVHRYFPNKRIFRCPSNDPNLDRTDVFPKTPPGSYIGGHLYTSYRVFFGLGSSLSGTYDWYGWYHAWIADPTDPAYAEYRSPCPNVKFLGARGRTTGTVGANIATYCAPPDSQAALLDVFEPDGFAYVVYLGPLSFARNNHAGGENALFFDGHAAWVAAHQARWRFHTVSGGADIYW